MRAKKPHSDDLPVDRDQREPVMRTLTETGSVLVTFGLGWITKRDPKKPPSMAGYKSSLDTVFIGE